ncbi:MAG: pilus (MSHA type) biogenesis protein MshL [Cycloclasticus sp.]
MTIRSAALLAGSFLVLAACAPASIKVSSHHIQETARPSGEPLPVLQTAPLPTPPSHSKQEDVFTVVVNDVPVKELLFAIARDANVEIDIAQDVDGRVTLNAIDRTFDQIISRVSRQADIRYSVEKGVVFVKKDGQFLKHYDVGYVNLARTSDSTIAISTEVASTGGTSGNSKVGNTSDTSINNKSVHQFWKTTVDNVRAILQEDEKVSAEFVAVAKLTGGQTERSVEMGEGKQSRVIASPESGLLSVFATQKQHHMVEKYLDLTLAGVKRQVFIEATIVEVELNDDYQAGVDWSRLVQAGTEGFSVSQALLGTNLAGAPVTTLTYNNPGSKYDLNATVKLLNQFGNTKVLSSPKLMVLNNQTALLKVVDNRVYFTVSVETDTSESGLLTRTFETEIHTVPVGLVMSVTPYISSENMVTLNVRPTISRILKFVEDPNPELGTGDAASLIPEISVREIESMLRVKSGDVAVIGGLMQDNHRYSTDGVPGLSKMNFIGDFFSYKDNSVSKSELVIFLKPMVAEKPTLNGQFAKYKRFLDAQESSAELGR